MPLTGTSKKTGAATAAAPTIRLKDLLDQLDSEWAQLRQEEHTEDEAGLLAYFHCCLRPLVQQIGGDPYSFTYPQEYADTERLPKLCAYLRGLQQAKPEVVQAARERNLAGLRAVWPAYRDLIQPDIPNGKSALDLEVLPFGWEALETGWGGEDDDPNRINFLPTFSTKASADFHLAALALLYLNRQLRLPLSDLSPHGGN